MKKIIILISLFFIISIRVDALSKNYNDLVSPIVNEKIEENKINLYLFYSESCPHCHAEMEYIEEDLLNLYKDKINFFKYEVSKNENNSEVLSSVKELFNTNTPYVPFTVIGNEYFVGFNDTIKGQITQVIDMYYNQDNQEKVIKTFDLPLIGEVKAKDASLGIVAIILGFIDGFNPCAMWILLLLINMTIGIKNRKKLFSIGLTFILTGGLVYFLSMLGIGFIVDLSMISIIRNIIAIVAILLGLYNLYTFVNNFKTSGCHVVDKKKRKNIISKIDKILSSKSIVFALVGTVILAFSVNLIELACSLGFPTIYLELLSINGVKGFFKIIYLLIYILFYLLDDIIIFLIAVFTLKSKGISTKYNNFVNLIGGILMIIMGILLSFKPEWIMFNF